ncbi:hypothetical protein CYLTODRAFT_455373 [Cylindrobasidium torrendii FP15055 ss-10]|uniref:Protein Zds1 C-terminal domain-containing protein n=1 Tax=Cylindrobasidium torrendii FP15055 ss-10 TaxID=1314674 RepID=A0A0D7B7D7_9AGAR|nr:hypothetical protein CYLTODRAFT_455373 [Cylindrobasidium torrendii FP15055 ss-10]
MQPSELEIQREVEVLRDLRRRSTTPGALILDPDLPSGSSGSNSPASTTWSGDGDSSSTSHDDDMSTDSHNGSAADDSPANDPFHLFWVPANVHPEIAPAEFRAFLKEHARSPPPPGEANLSRSGSLSSLSGGSLSRKKSMLSRQYRPSANDGVGEGAEEEIVPVKRTPSLYRQGPQLTISDLQRLEELADEASQSDDPTRLRTMLRRSLSMNVSPSAMDRMDSIPDVGDEADAPILVPPSQQLLRRANRTKIRKAHLSGDGGGHRFAATRRVHGGRSSTGSITEKRSSSDRSSSEHGDEFGSRRRTFDKEPFNQRPESYSEEASIYDAYAREDDEPVEEARPAVVVTTAPPAELSPIVEPIFDDFETPTLQTPVLHQPQPHRMLSPGQVPEEQSSSRTPSPSDASGPISVSSSHSQEPPAVSAPPHSHAPHPSQSPPPQHRKDKDKKGLFKWGSDKGGKKAGGKPETQQRAEKEKEKDSGFFGSLFGGKKHKENEAGSPGNGMLGGREAAVALLGGSKSAKAYNAPPSPTPSTPGVDNWSRYPIHVERAIYRLSHIKLANPRRPLYEQVLISNLMFWYLGVINKAQNPAPAQAVNGQAAPAGNAAGAGAIGGAHSHAAQQQQQEEQERLEKERQEKERQEREQREQEQNRKRDVSPKRGPLTKPARGDGRRGAEMPVKGPQYDMQHRAMEDEYMFNGPPPNARGGPPQQQQPLEGGADYYQQSYQQNLPPGAMPPPQPQHSPHRRSRSPPQQHQAHGSYDNGNHRPQRSVSATAVAAPPSQPNGKIRKGHSAYAGKPTQQNGRPTPQREPSEDEDMPLAMWQQQQQQRRR